MEELIEMIETVLNTQPPSKCTAGISIFSSCYLTASYTSCIWLLFIPHQMNQVEKISGKNYRRVRFQMDLGLQLINYAIEQEWTNGDWPRQSWMVQNSFLYCNCNKCFFCLNGYCNGVYHKPDTMTTVYEVARKKRKIHGCTDERVQILKRSVYCCMCYRNSSGATAPEKRKNWKNSKFGCPKCAEPICGGWETGYDMHKK